MPAIDNEGVRCFPAPTCACCGKPGRMLHKGLRDELFGAPGVWNIKRCLQPDCGLAWVDPMPIVEDIGKLYENYYTHGNDDEHALLEAGAELDPIDVSQFVSTGKVAGLKRLFKKMLPWRRFSFDSDFVYLGSGTPGRVLDVGCGAGDYLRVAKEAGWEPVGIDFDEKAIAMARLKGIEAHVGDLVSVNFPADSFDAITMSNVIEHLPDPKSVFAECLRILKPGGRLIMMTPNIDSYCHAHYGPDWRGLEIPRHVYLYSAKTLRRFSKEAGFGHVEAFSQLRNEGAVEFMTLESKKIAAATGRTYPEPDAHKLGRKGAMRAWLGISRGEWVHLVAQK